MAGPLRRVSQNYNWTIKRAHNDLHNSISPDPPSTSTPSTNIGSAVVPWDSARLQWKFKSEYDELREHFESSLLILLGWWLTFKQLTKAKAEQFINEPDQAVSKLYQQGSKVTIHDILSLPIWGLLAAVFQYVVPRIAGPARPFLSRAIYHLGVNKSEETGGNPTFSHSPPDERPVSPYTESTAHAPEGSPTPTITVLSDSLHSALDGSVMEALRDGIERLHSAIHIGGEKSFHGSPSLDGDIRKPHEYANTNAGLFD